MLLGIAQVGSPKEGAVQIAIQSVLIAGWTLYVVALLLRRPETDSKP